MMGYTARWRETRGRRGEIVLAERLKGDQPCSNIVTGKIVSVDGNF